MKQIACLNLQYSGKRTWMVYYFLRSSWDSEVCIPFSHRRGVVNSSTTDVVSHRTTTTRWISGEMNLVCQDYIYYNIYAVWPSMVTHTQNLGSAFNPSKCTLTVVNTMAPGEQLGVRCLAQCSHLSKVERTLVVHSPHRQLLPDPRFKPTTSGYKSDALSIRPRLSITSLSVPFWFCFMS